MHPRTGFLFFMLIVPATAAAETPRECACRTLTVSGVLPKSAVGLNETSPDDFAKLDPANRPVARLDLDQDGYAGEELFVRFTKTALSTWQAEILQSDPANSSDTTAVDTFAPLTFGEDGKSVNRFCGETRAAKHTAENFGDRLYLCFEGLKQGAAADAFNVARAQTVSCPCFEYAKPLIGAEELSKPDSKYRTRYYNAEEGYAAMLKDVAPPADE